MELAKALSAALTPKTAERRHSDTDISVDDRITGMQETPGQIGKGVDAAQRRLEAVVGNDGSEDGEEDVEGLN